MGWIVLSDIGQNASPFETFADDRTHRPAVYPQPKPVEFFIPGKDNRKPDHLTDFFTCVRLRANPIQ